MWSRKRLRYTTLVLLEVSQNSENIRRFANVLTIYHRNGKISDNPLIGNRFVTDTKMKLQETDLGTISQRKILTFENGFFLSESFLTHSSVDLQVCLCLGTLRLYNVFTSSHRWATLPPNFENFATFSDPIAKTENPSSGRGRGRTKWFLTSGNEKTCF